MQYGNGQDMPPQTSQYLCLDLLLAFVNYVTARAEGVSDSVTFEEY